MIRRIISSTRVSRAVLPPEIAYSHRVTEALKVIEEKYPTTTQKNESKPIFILSCGWGTGSTLLQRLIVSSGEVAMWGEPFDRAIPLQRLAASLSAILPDWPPQGHYLDSQLSSNFKDLSSKWIANLIPSFQYLREAHVAFFESWLARPALDMGLSRWGVKEVRWTIHHARYLKWLFPNARFIFLCRNLIDTYRSCKNRDWYISWPHYRTNNIIAFAHHWKLLADGFLNGHKELGGILIRYEDIIGLDFDISIINDHIETKNINTEILGKKLGARGEKNDVSATEKYILKSIAGEQMNALGYQ